MSTFSVEVVRLDDVLVHPNADALELAQIGGYRAVVQKGLHKPGDTVVYVPEDAVIPQDVIDAWGFTGKLAGKAKNRVKAIRLRGELSQGLVIPVATAQETIKLRNDQKVASSESRDFEAITGRSAEVLVDNSPLQLGDDVSEELGIEKYEEEIPVSMRGMARSRPSWFPYYTDIENIKKYNRVFEPGEPVIMTEKIHGTNFGVGMHSEDHELLVSSRRLVLQRDDKNLYWRAASQYNLAATLSSILFDTKSESVVLWGEIFGNGVQDLAYGMTYGEFSFRAFDLMIDEKYVDAREFLYIMQQRKIPAVPVLYLGPYSEEAVASVTDGLDTLAAAHVREGAVIRPGRERETRGVGRVILKSVSADYLLRKNGTERH